MLALGLVLVVLSAMVIIGALLGGSNDEANFNLGLFDVETNTLGVFLLGAATALFLAVGVQLVIAGTRHSNRRRREHRELNRLTEEAEARAKAAGRSPAGQRSEARPGDGPAPPPPGTTRPG